jgi:hypothetical protein
MNTARSFGPGQSSWPGFHGFDPWDPWPKARVDPCPAFVSSSRLFLPSPEPGLAASRENYAALGASARPSGKRKVFFSYRYNHRNGVWGGGWLSQLGTNFGRAETSNFPRPEVRRSPALIMAIPQLVALIPTFLRQRSERQFTQARS